jgi:tetratricopeptide (TPR) repeat protein
MARVPAFTDAETLWRDTLEKTPTSDIAYHNLSVLYLSQNRAQDSLALTSRALAAGVRTSGILLNHGVALDLLGRADEELPFFEEAARLDPGNAYAHFNVGLNLLERHHDLDEAERAFQQTLALTPYDAATHYQLGRIARERGQFDAARQRWERALSLQPDMEEARDALRALTASPQPQDHALVRPSPR